MSERILKLSIPQWHALPHAAFGFPHATFKAQLRRPWYVLTFNTPADLTMFTLRYSEYCGKIHPFEEFRLYSTQDLYEN